MTALPPAVSPTLRAFCLVALCGAALLAAGTLHAQQRPALVTQAVNEAARVTLAGNVHPLARQAADRGAVSDSASASRMLLLLRRSPEQESRLRDYLESLQDANSPNFHKWLTPAQFGAQWGPADSDVAAVTAWLQGHGFSVAGLTPGRIAIEFSGTAGQVRQAFQTEIHAYAVNGEVHHANNANPTIPAALAPVVAGIATLNDFHPKIAARPGPRGIYNMATHQARQALTSSGGSGDFLYVGPADAATIYDTPIAALNPNYTGMTVDGTGAAIGVAGDAFINVSQNANYRSLFGLAANAPTIVVDGGTNPGINGDSVEFYLDTQVSSGIAPGAKLYFYTSAGTDVEYGVTLAALRAVDDNVVDVLSLSWEECEAYLGASGNYFVNALWEQAAAQGISVSVASSDSGSAGCDDFDTQTEAIAGLQVNGWSSTPYNISVGGTDFAGLIGADFTQYVSPTSAAGTLRSAKGYIPESPWNDSIANFPPGSLAANTNLPAAYQNIVAGSGGKSNCTSGSVNAKGVPACSGGYAKPSWQVAPGVPDDKARDLPDVSLLAGNGYYAAAWAICIDQDYNQNGELLTDCTPGADGLPSNEFYIYGVGGTSAAAPAFAGILALIKSATGERQGQADHVLYNLARTHPEVYHDIVTGNNSVPCAAGSPGCARNTAGYYYETGYDAGTGYDLASGLGSVDAAALIANWSSAGLAATTTALTATPATIVHGTAVTVDASVTGSGGTPSGDVALIANVNPSAQPNSSAVTTFTLNSSGSTGAQQVNSLPGGSYSLLAHYGGSASFAQSTSAPVAIKVTPESSTTLVTVNGFDPSTGYGGSSASLPYGYYLAFDAQPYGNHSTVANGQVEPDGAATGKVVFALNSASYGTATINAEGYAEIDPNGLNDPPPGNYTLKAAYSGDASFNASSGSHGFSITKGPTQIAMTASATTYAGKPIVFTIALGTDSIGVAPTGTVSLKNGSAVLATANLTGSGPTDVSLASGTATISLTNPPEGQLQVVAVYSGDTNYAGSGSNTIAITGKGAFTLTGTSVALSSERGTAAAGILTKSLDGYAGTINYTCALTSKSSAAEPPECAMDPATETLAANGTAEPQMLIFGKGTRLPGGITVGSNSRRAGAASAALALAMIFGIPARRRGWKAMLAAVLLLVSAGSFTACGGGGSGKTITRGSYTFQVTGKDSKDASITASATVQVTVP